MTNKQELKKHRLNNLRLCATFGILIPAVAVASMVYLITGLLTIENIVPESAPESAKDIVLFGVMLVLMIAIIVLTFVLGTVIILEKNRGYHKFLEVLETLTEEEINQKHQVGPDLPMIKTKDLTYFMPGDPGYEEAPTNKMYATIRAALFAENLPVEK